MAASSFKPRTDQGCAPSPPVHTVTSAYTFRDVARMRKHLGGACRPLLTIDDSRRRKICVKKMPTVAEESPDLAGPLVRPERARGPFPPFCVSATLMHFHSGALYPPSTPICTHTQISCTHVHAQVLTYVHVYCTGSQCPVSLP